MTKRIRLSNKYIKKCCDLKHELDMKPEFGFLDSVPSPRSGAELSALGNLCRLMNGVIYKVKTQDAFALPKRGFLGIDIYCKFPGSFRRWQLIHKVGGWL